MVEIRRATLCGVLTLLILGAVGAARGEDAGAVAVAVPTPAEQAVPLAA
jgi:hypothetical protein